jgi:hypothetical protein
MYSRYKTNNFKHLGNIRPNVPFLLNALSEELNSVLVIWRLQKLGKDQYMKF